MGHQQDTMAASHNEHSKQSKFRHSQVGTGTCREKCSAVMGLWKPWKRTRGTKWGKEWALLSFSTSGATCRNFLLQALYPNLRQAPPLKGQRLEKWRELKQMEQQGKVWLHQCEERMEKEPWDEPHVGWRGWWTRGHWRLFHAKETSSQ